MSTTAQYTTTDWDLPTSTIVTEYAPCQYCGRADFRHVMHRRNHVAKCQAEAFADMAAHAVVDGDADIDAYNAAGAIARSARAASFVAREEI